MQRTALIENQREAIKKAHNARFTMNDKEYRIKYEGGIAESFGVYGRPVGGKVYSYVAGFAGFKLFSREQVIAMAKEMVRKH